MPTLQNIFIPLGSALVFFTTSTAAFALPIPSFYSVRSLSAAGGEAATAPVDESSTSGRGDLPQALIFDCDGVLADTERDGHRPAFNAAFKIKNLDCKWDVELYGKLLSVGGGKERMTAHWNEVGWPDVAKTPEERTMLVKELHLLKTALFNQAVVDGELPLRNGVLRLTDEAIVKKVPLAVCSTSNEKAVTNLVRTLMGPDRLERIKIFAGDVVERKKPHPDIYNLAKVHKRTRKLVMFIMALRLGTVAAIHQQSLHFTLTVTANSGRDTMGLDPARVVVIEDSHIGLQAAKAAGMNCLVTKSSYTGDEDFSAADRVTEELGGDSDASGAVTLATLAEIVRERTSVAS